MFSQFTKELSEQLQLPLPGREVQFRMAHVNRIAEAPDRYRNSAVLIFIHEIEHQLYIPLIERVTYNGPHSGQIALPGGKYEDSDKILEQTAIREYREETGNMADLTLLGQLTPLYIPVSNFMVHPYIAYATQTPLYDINPGEVQQLIEWNLRELTNEATIKETTLEPVHGMKIKTPYFDVQGKILWGATAMILNELKYLLQRNSAFTSFYQTR